METTERKVAKDKHETMPPAMKFEWKEWENKQILNEKFLLWFKEIPDNNTIDLLNVFHLIGIGLHENVISECYTQSKELLLENGITINKFPLIHAYILTY